ncbi:protein of unknown function (plasmid) [Streptantibioticus cattleyicolor NRRL 8057 = DSM 46488]|nr:protein of unknown function [Streptantibioticus cattleyicolor NRRL 8057 = DSM 46488]
MMSEPFPAPVDLDLRLVQCFTVVAEHRHFGRAAEALHTTQPSLSRQIRRLEQQVGVRLLDRTTHAPGSARPARSSCPGPRGCCVPRSRRWPAPGPRPGPAASPSATPRG